MVSAFRLRGRGWGAVETTHMNSISVHNTSKRKTTSPSGGGSPEREGGDAEENFWRTGELK